MLVITPSSSVVRDKNVQTHQQPDSNTTNYATRYAEIHVV